MSATEAAADQEHSQQSAEPVFCICRGPDDGRFMVYCESCAEWYHIECIGLTKRDVRHIDRYVCDRCKRKKEFQTDDDVMDDAEQIFRRLQQMSSDQQFQSTYLPSEEISNQNSNISSSNSSWNRDGTAESKRRASSSGGGGSTATAKKVKPNSSASLVSVRQDDRETRIRAVKLLKQALGKFASEATQPLVSDKAKELEKSLYRQQERSITKTYQAKIKSLAFNLQDAKNVKLSETILQGKMPVEKVISMDSWDLANEELARERQRIEEEAEQKLILREDEVPNMDASSVARIRPQSLDPVRTNPEPVDTPVMPIISSGSSQAQEQQEQQEQEEQQEQQPPPPVPVSSPLQATAAATSVAATTQDTSATVTAATTATTTSIAAATTTSTIFRTAPSAPINLHTAITPPRSPPSLPQSGYTVQLVGQPPCQVDLHFLSGNRNVLPEAGAVIDCTGRTDTVKLLDFLQQLRAGRSSSKELSLFEVIPIRDDTDTTILQDIAHLLQKNGKSGVSIRDGSLVSYLLPPVPHKVRVGLEFTREGSCLYAVVKKLS